MSRPFRTLAALLALFALTAYFAESVAAAMCMPGMQMDHAEMDIHTDSAGHSSLHDASSAAPAESQEAPAQAPTCPLGIAGSGSSCSAAPLPAATVSVRLLPPAYTPTVSEQERSDDQLLIAAHFRPPRV